MTKEIRNLLIHTLSCIAFLSIPILSSPDFNLDLSNQFKVLPFQQSFFSYILLLLFFYLNYYYLIPKYYLSQKSITYTVFLLVAFAFFLLLPYLLFPANHDDFGKVFPNNEHPMPPPGRFKPLYFGDILSFGMVLSLSFLLRLNSQLSKIKTEKLNAEVSYLKAQINPHFLFNTLNSLYALAIIKSDDTPFALLKLSGMMRYVVTESSQDFVPLEKEINYIKDYIDLQKLRMGEDTTFSFAVDGSPFGKIIAPLLLIPFIENAFKYGLNPEEDSEISILLEIHENHPTLDVKNKMVVNEISEELKSEKGIENTTKRLNFIYPQKHQFTKTEDQNTYHIYLKLELI